MPERYVDETVFNHEVLPIQLKAHVAATLVYSSKEKQLNGYCPVCLILGKDIELSKGQDLRMVQYGNVRYLISSQENTFKFMEEPKRYINAKLPVKLPPAKNPITLLQLSEMENSIPFLE